MGWLRQGMNGELMKTHRVLLQLSADVAQLDRIPLGLNRYLRTSTRTNEPPHELAWCHISSKTSEMRLILHL
eukprot:scaffold254712_cov14-Tisochrysis_lutea.AAC.1